MGTPPGSSVQEILQARVLEWVVRPSSRGSSWPRDQTRISCGSCIASRFFATETPGKLRSKLVFFSRTRFPSLIGENDYSSQQFLSSSNCGKDTLLLKTQTVSVGTHTHTHTHTHTLNRLGPLGCAESPWKASLFLPSSFQLSSERSGPGVPGQRWARAAPTVSPPLSALISRVA